MSLNDHLAVQLQALMDRTAISDLLFRYAASIDQRDWQRFASCFTDDVVADYGELGAPGTPGRDALMRWVRGGISGFDATQHLSANHEITVDGDRARSSSYLQAVHYLAGAGPPDKLVLGGYYLKDYRRGAEGWQINRLSLVLTWREGDMGLFALAIARRRAGHH